MEQVEQFVINLLDGSITQDEIDNFVNKLKNNQLDNELNEIKKMIEDQLSYSNPLKLNKQAEFHQLGNHNKKILDALNALKDSDDVSKSLSELKAIFA